MRKLTIVASPSMLILPAIASLPAGAAAATTYDFRTTGYDIGSGSTSGTYQAGTDFTVVSGWWDDLNTSTGYGTVLCGIDNSASLPAGFVGRETSTLPGTLRNSATIVTTSDLTPVENAITVNARYAQNTSSYNALIFGYQDSGNFYYFKQNGATGQLVFGKVVGGSFTNLSNTTPAGTISYDPANGDIFDLSLAWLSTGSVTLTISRYQNDGVTPVYTNKTLSRVDATFALGGKVGFSTFSSSGDIMNVMSLTANTQSAGVAPDAVSDIFDANYVLPHTMDVLANDALGTPVAAIDSFTQPTTGTVVKNADNTFTYTYTGPNNWTGSDSFTYTLKNATGSDTATVTLNNVPEPASMGLIGLGGLAILGRYHRRRK